MDGSTLETIIHDVAGTSTIPAPMPEIPITNPETLATDSPGAPSSIIPKTDGSASVPLVAYTSVPEIPVGVPNLSATKTILSPDTPETSATDSEMIDGSVVAQKNDPQ